MNIGLIGFGSMGCTHSYAVMSLPFYDKNLPFFLPVMAAYRSDASGKTERVNGCE